MLNKFCLYVYKFLIDLYRFLKNVHSDSSEGSSKRVYGGIGFICSIIMIWTGAQNSYVETLLFVSATMIVGGTIENLIKRK